LTADLAAPRLTDRRRDECDDLADASIYWAVLNVLDDADLDVHDVAVVRAARTHLNVHLADNGITTGDLFDHIADAVEHNDWSAFGLPDPED
jgi:hypothetical protein